MSNRVLQFWASETNPGQDIRQIPIHLSSILFVLSQSRSNYLWSPSL